MSEQPEYLYYRDLFNIFKAYTTPKLMRVLDSQGIKYFTDAKGKPFTTRSAIEGALGSESIELTREHQEPVVTATSLS
jgi:predicted flavoprotein YhiN